MNCPLCLDPALEERFSNGIEVDVCPNCTGIWLDRGELERLMTKTADAPAPWRGDEPAPQHLVPAHQDRKPEDVKRERQSRDRDNNRDRDRVRDRERDGDRDRDRDGDRDRDRNGSSRRESKKKSRRERWGDMLEDVLDDVLDL